MKFTPTRDHADPGSDPWDSEHASQTLTTVTIKEIDGQTHFCPAHWVLRNLIHSHSFGVILFNWGMERLGSSLCKVEKYLIEKWNGKNCVYTHTHAHTLYIYTHIIYKILLLLIYNIWYYIYICYLRWVPFNKTSNNLK